MADPIQLANGDYYTTFQYRGKSLRRYWIKGHCSECGKECFLDRACHRKALKNGSAGAACSRACARGKAGLKMRGPDIRPKSRTSKYLLQRAADHPHARNGFVPQHRMIMEAAIGRLLRRDEFIHHIDGDPLNNAIDNLIIVSSYQHNFAHNTLEACAAELMRRGHLKFDRVKLEYFVSDRCD